MNESQVHESHDVRKDVKAYLAVFGALLALTVLTVGVSYIPAIHARVALAFTVGLLIAAVKASLVALFFMHLKAERKVIYWTLLLTFVFFVALFSLPLWHYYDDLVSPGP